MPKVIDDARTERDPFHKIQEGIVKGVLAETGLPKISNVIQGDGKSMRESAMSGKGKATPTEEVPKTDRMRTKQESGGARYIGSQKKK